MDIDELRSIGDAARIATDLQHCWLRGQPKSFGSLFPGIQREPFLSGPENIEFRAAQRFRLRASIDTSNVKKNSHNNFQKYFSESLTHISSTTSTDNLTHHCKQNRAPPSNLLFRREPNSLKEKHDMTHHEKRHKEPAS
jgi:hypothetical protein